jgi:hypothetical protein
MPDRKPTRSQLVRRYRKNESANRRGPCFKELANALEREIWRKPDVSDVLLMECLGPPNLWNVNREGGIFVYYFDHKVAGRNRDEWFFHLKGQKVYSSGFNRRGINDLSFLEPSQLWPAQHRVRKVKARPRKPKRPSA